MWENYFTTSVCSAQHPNAGWWNIQRERERERERESESQSNLWKNPNLSNSWKFLQTQTFFLNFKTSSMDRTNSSLFKFRFRSSTSGTAFPLPLNLGKMASSLSLRKSEVGSAKSSLRKSSSSENPKMIVFGFMAPIPDILKKMLIFSWYELFIFCSETR